MRAIHLRYIKELCATACSEERTLGCFVGMPTNVELLHFIHLAFLIPKELLAGVFRKWTLLSCKSSECVERDVDAVSSAITHGNPLRRHYPCAC